MPLTIWRRDEWRAVRPNGCDAAPLPADECYLHHSDTAPPGPLWADEVAAVRQLERIGHERFGCGISYTWVVMPDGCVFEGHSPDREGTHTYGHNTRGRGIVLVGRYSSTAPTPEQVRSVAWLLQQAKARGWLRHARLTGGHRDVRNTKCPGDAAYALIAEINRQAAGPPIVDQPRRRRPDETAPAAAPAPTQQGGPSMFVTHVPDGSKGPADNRVVILVGPRVVDISHDGPARAALQAEFDAKVYRPIPFDARSWAQLVGPSPTPPAPAQ